ncbi:MAG: acetyl/propionyl/methylcrotonyl-CoA carboxylase subunit alpha [Thermomicrobiales bacterium]
MSEQAHSPVAGTRVAIANRSEIAVRIAATCQRLEATPILLLGEPDRDGFAARQVGRVERIGEAGSELDLERVIAAAQRVSADYLHPGYGFLSERAELADACQTAGIRFVGPSAETLRRCGDKLATRAGAERASVPVLPASPPLGADPETWKAAARAVGFPLLVKPTGAGGGRGLRFVAEEATLVEAVAASRREGGGDGAVYLERALIAPRHVEVQVAGDGHTALAIGDRDCSLQRRHQKVIEEAPAPNVDESTRTALHKYAQRIADEVGLRGIATCEFLLGQDGTIAFLEVNPRIQVEHPVTELVTGIDLVEWQLLIAAGGVLPNGDFTPRGHAIEARVYAEDPAQGFFPSAGTLDVVAWPKRSDVRVDAGYETGNVVPSTYDPMLAKIIARGFDRDSALHALRVALRETIVAGLPSNLSWLLALLNEEATRVGRATTQTASEVAPTMPDRRLAVAAAVAHTLDRARQSTSDPWTAVGPLRLSGAATLTFHGTDWEERLSVRQSNDGWKIVREGETVPLSWWQDSQRVWTVKFGEDVARFAVVVDDDNTVIYGNGGRWVMKTGRRPSAEGARRKRTSDGLIRAPLPGRVMVIHAAAGDHVGQGQPLVTLSAMKIELVCDAPAVGTIESVSCEVGQLVDAGVVLVSMRTEDQQAQEATAS